jgi:O-antigen/teichoic acid export membrane protein
LSRRKYQGCKQIRNGGHLPVAEPADEDNLPGPGQATASEEAHVDPLDKAGAGATVIRGSVVRLGGHVLGALASLAATVVIIRHLGVVDTGRLVTVMTLIVIVGAISDLGLSTVGVREYSVRPPGEGHRFLRNLLGMRAAFAIGGLVVAVAFAVVAGYTADMRLGTFMAGLGMALFVFQQSLTIPLQVSLRFNWVAALQLMIQVGIAVEAVLLSRAGVGLLPFFVLQLPVMLPVLALTVLVGGRETRAPPAADVKEWGRMLRKILPYSAAVVLSVLYFRIVLVMVSLLSSDVETGYFSAAFRLLDGLTTIPAIVVSSALPILARTAHGNTARFNSASRRIAQVAAVSGVGLALIVGLGSEFIINVAAGPGFEESVSVLRILSIALMGTFLIAARGYALLSLGKLKAMLISNALAFGLVAAVGVPLIRAHGATGAAVTLVAAELALCACYELAATRQQRALRLRLSVVARLLFAASMAVSLVSVLHLTSLGMAAVGGVVYSAMVLLLRVLPPDFSRALYGRATAQRGRIDRGY